jgi:hypothetical protein
MTRTVHMHLLAMLQRVRAHIMQRNTAERGARAGRMRPIRFVWQGMQPVAVHKVEMDCRGPGSDWRTHTRMWLWHHMAAAMVRETNRQIADDIKVTYVSGSLPGAALGGVLVREALYNISMVYALPCRRGGWMSGPGRARRSRWSRVSGGCRR